MCGYLPGVRDVMVSKWRGSLTSVFEARAAFSSRSQRKAPHSPRRPPNGMLTFLRRCAARRSLFSLAFRFLTAVSPFGVGC